MSDKNNIDGLFKSKLAGREVAYSASAWAGASQMLDKHFRLLFLKKLFLFGIPLFTLIGFGALILWPEEQGNQVARESSSEHVVTQKIASAQIVQPETKKQSNESTLEINKIESDALSYQTNAVDQKVVDHNSLALNKSLKNASSSSSKMPVEEVEKQSTEPNIAVDALGQESLAANTASYKIPETAPERVSNLGPSIAKGTLKTEMVSTEVASILLNSNLDLMSIPSIGDGIFMANANLLRPEFNEPTAKVIRKTQIYAEGGILIAQGHHDLNLNRMPIGLGVHARMLAKYHLGQSVYLDLGVGMYNRGSTTKGKAVAGSQPGSAIEITPVSLNYGSILVGTGYRIGLRHAVGGGFELNPLLTVISKEEKMVAGESTGASYITDKTGFAGLDASFVINHRFTIKERLDLCTELHCGIFDATDNAVFKTGDVNDFNTAIKMGVSYRLTQR